MNYIRILTLSELEKVVTQRHIVNMVDSLCIFKEHTNSKYEGKVGILTRETYLHHPIIRMDKTDFVLDGAAYEKVIGTNPSSLKTRLYSNSFLNKLCSCEGSLVLSLLNLYQVNASDLDMRNISLTEEGLMSYSNGKHKKNTIKIGRGILKILDMFNIPFCKNVYIEELSNNLKSTAMTKRGFSIAEGKKLLRYYNENSYDWDVNLGSLGKSCMRKKECAGYLKIYTDNSKICKMLLYSDPSSLNKGKIKARALLWTLASGETFMDRVYGDDVTIQLFKEYAKRKKYLYKKVQTFRDKDLIMINDNEEVRREMRIKLKNPLSSYKYFPYFDTFTYDAGDNEMINIPDYVMIGKFDNIYGSYKKYSTCYISKEKTFGELREYIDKQGNYHYALPYLLVENRDILRYIEKSKSVMTCRGVWTYLDKKNMIFLNTQNAYEHTQHTFVCSYDGKKYSNYIATGDRNIKMYIIRNNKKVHVLNDRFVESK